MITRTDVELAYRLLLGRAPESQEVVEQKLAQFSSAEELRESFFACQEFQENLRAFALSRSPVDGNRAMQVDDSIGAAALERMFSHVARTWQKLGETEPHWSVLIEDRFKRSHFQDNEQDFYQSGESWLGVFTDAAARAGIDLANFFTCFELGCGVGRITWCLSRLFENIIAADISHSHLGIARRATADRKNIRFIHLKTPTQFSELPAFDVFFSLIVLQHNPPPVIRAILESVLTGLSVGGIGFFQLPVYARDYNFSSEEYLTKIVRRADMEMHVLPQPVLFNLIRDTGCDILDLRQDGLAGPLISNTLLVRKVV